jgi:hypothetical protein
VQIHKITFSPGDRDYRGRTDVFKEINTPTPPCNRDLLAKTQFREFASRGKKVLKKRL